MVEERLEPVPGGRERRRDERARAQVGRVLDAALRATGTSSRGYRYFEPRNRYFEAYSKCL
jgi:hypothetical protein